MSVKPMIDDIELSLVQNIEAEDEEVIAQHGVPVLEGDFLQDLGRRASRISLTGVMIGEDVADDLKKLKDKFRSAEPVSFVADIATATKVDKMLIEEMGIRDLAGKPERFEYALTLREFISPPPTKREDPPKHIDPVNPETATLIVEVIVEGELNFDFSTVTLTVKGTTQNNGMALSRTLTNRENGVWTEEDFPVGQYIAKALVIDPPSMSGSKDANVREKQTTRVEILLRRGAVIAKQFVIHYRFDNAFVEPCMRCVLQKVATYAQTHPNEKLLIVGHTDLTGSDEYNQSLSERRARGIYAYLIFGRNRTSALAEWDQLRHQRTSGVWKSINDSWGVREYQYMLQNLGFYPGNVDGVHGSMTDDAVRTFQQDKGLSADGIVGNATWLALMDAYLSQDNFAIPESIFLPNASNGCGGGILKWLGCGEIDPVRDTQDAWRPNRRTELLFVTEDSLPTKVRKPDTFELPPPSGAGTTWCLGDSSVKTHCCFVKPHIPPRKENCPPPSDRESWTRVPAESETVIVRGSIKFEDDTPAANMRYVLIAPDGEFLHKNATEKADLGEVPKDDKDEKRGHPVFPLNKTDANGEFSYPAQSFAGHETTVGVYTLEIMESVVARLKGKPINAAKGNGVCKRLDGTSDFDVIVVSQSVFQVRPSIVLTTSIVVVKKLHTNPMRQPVTLRVNVLFTGTGTFTRSKGNIRFFTDLVNGTEINFDGVDNVFTPEQLVAGHILYTEGATPSVALNDVELTLLLTVTGQIGFADRVSMTSVELNLDVALSRTVLAADPPVMPANDKINIGRHIQVSDPSFSHERAMLIVRQPNPATFVGTLVLAPLNAQVQVFDAEIPASDQVAIPSPRIIPSGSIPTNGLRFFAEGRTVSVAVRDTGFQLGIQNLENDGDRVPMTAVQFDVTTTPNAEVLSTSFVRFGLWDQAFDSATGNLRNGAADANHFIGADSRHFFFRVRDPSAVGSPQMEWRTVKADGTADDAPVGQPLQIRETAPSSHLFFSRPVFMVTDNIDRQLTGSGLSAADVALLMPRIRKVTVDDTHPLDGKLVATYTPAAGQVMRATSVLFERAVEERRRLRVHLVDVRSSVGGVGTLTAARRNLFKQVCRSIYSVCGIFVDFDEFQIDPPAACIAWTANYPGDPLAINPAVEGFTLPGANLVPSATQLAIINAVRARPEHIENDLYLVFVERIYQSPVSVPPGALVSGSRGESFPDSWVAAGAVTRGFTFVGLRGGVTNTTETHELTHMTTNLRNSVGGHFDIGDLRDTRNLMHNGTIDNGCLGTKRVWNTAFNNAAIAPSAIPAQIDTIRTSRFVHPF